MIKYRDLIDSSGKPATIKTRFKLLVKPQLRNIDLKEIVAEYGPYYNPYMISGWLDSNSGAGMELTIFSMIVKNYI